MSLVLNLSAVVALVPATLLSVRPLPVGDTRFWVALAVATVGAVGWSLVRIGEHWDIGLGVALWVSISSTLIAYWGLVLLWREAAGLVVLLAPYLLLAGVIASLLDRPSGAGMTGGLPPGMIAIHVAATLATYGMATLAAIAGIAGVLKEQTLKSKREWGWAVALPSVWVAEALQFRLLVGALAVLVAGIVTGMSLQWSETGSLLASDHKTVLSLVAAGVLAAILVLHARAGLRGRQAARAVLAAYLLLTLAYPGVKAVRLLLTGD